MQTQMEVLFHLHEGKIHSMCLCAKEWSNIDYKIYIKTEKACKSIEFFTIGGQANIDFHLRTIDLSFNHVY